MSQSTKKFIRREKARIRRQFLDAKKQKELINKLYADILKKPEAGSKPAEVKEIKKNKMSFPQVLYPLISNDFSVSLYSFSSTSTRSTLASLGPTAQAAKNCSTLSADPWTKQSKRLTSDAFATQPVKLRT